jgi:hypothetical protein
MDNAGVNARAAYPVYGFPEKGCLPESIRNVAGRGGIGNREMSGGSRVFQAGTARDKLSKGGGVCGAAAHPAHAGIYFKMNGQPDVGGRGFPGKGIGKFEIGNKGAQAQPDHGGYFIGKGLGKQQNRRTYPGLPQLFALFHSSDRKAGSARFKAGPADLNRTVPVGVRLYRNANPAIRAYPPLYLAEVMRKTAQMNNRPGSHINMLFPARKRNIQAPWQLRHYRAFDVAPRPGLRRVVEPAGREEHAPAALLLER